MPGKRPLALELAGDDQRLEVRVVVAGDPDDGIVEAALDQAGNLIRIHFGYTAWLVGRGVYRESVALPNPRA